MRQARRIHDAEPSALLQQLHACGHLRFILLLQQVVVGCLALVVTASQVCQLLLSNWFLIQSRLIVIDLRFQHRDGMLSICDFKLIRSQLALYGSHHRRLGSVRSGADWARAIATVRRVIRTLVLQACQKLVPQFFGLCDLVFQFAYIGMAIRVVRTEVGKLRFELL